LLLLGVDSAEKRKVRACFQVKAGASHPLTNREFLL
jgi:hypothetical protein